MGWSSQLAVLRGESASVKTLQGTIQALEHDKANLQERVQRLEKDLAAGPDTINKSSGKSGLNIWSQLTLLAELRSVLCEVTC